MDLFFVFEDSQIIKVNDAFWYFCVLCWMLSSAFFIIKDTKIVEDPQDAALLAVSATITGLVCALLMGAAVVVLAVLEMFAIVYYFLVAGLIVLGFSMFVVNILKLAR